MKWRTEPTDSVYCLHWHRVANIDKTETGVDRKNVRAAFDLVTTYQSTISVHSRAGHLRTQVRKYSVFWARKNILYIVNLSTQVLKWVRNLIKFLHRYNTQDAAAGLVTENTAFHHLTYALASAWLTRVHIFSPGAFLTRPSWTAKPAGSLQCTSPDTQLWPPGIVIKGNMLC